jgi:hypothetical protein
MTQDAFERGYWQTVIDAHLLNCHDVKEWLRYASALLHTLQASPQAGKQQHPALAMRRQGLKLYGTSQTPPGWLDENL